MPAEERLRQRFIQLAGTGPAEVAAEAVQVQPELARPVVTAARGRQRERVLDVGSSARNQLSAACSAQQADGLVVDSVPGARDESSNRVTSSSARGASSK